MPLTVATIYLIGIHHTIFLDPYRMSNLRGGFVRFRNQLDRTGRTNNGFDTLRTLCIDGITANEEKCRRDVHNSIGVVTALNPVIGYKNSTKIAKEALETGKGVYELVLEHNILSKEDLDTILKPGNMIKPVKLDIHPNR